MTSAELVDLLTQLGFMLFAAVAMGFVMRKLRQPAVVGEMAAGVILGVTILGSLAPGAHDWLFDAGALVTSTRGDIIKLGMLFFLFVAGSEVDLSDVKALGRPSLIIGLVGTVLPIAGGIGLVYVTPVSLWGASVGIGRLPFAAFIGMNLANSANPVLARILIDLGLMKSRIATMMMTATVVDDLINWTLYAIILGSVTTGAESGSDRGLAIDLALVALLFVTVLGGVRWLAPRMVEVARRHLAWPSGYVAVVAMVVITVSAVSEAIGVQGFLGAFLAGVAFSGVAGGPGATGQKSLTHVAVGFFAPLYFVSMALQTDFIESFEFVLVLTVFLFALASKLISVIIGVKAAGLPIGREAWAVAWGLNARGATGIILASTGLQAGIISEEVFVALVIMAILTSILAGPMMLRALGPLRTDMREGEDLLAADASAGVLAYAARMVDREMTESDRARASIFYRVAVSFDDPTNARPLVEVATALATSQQPGELVLMSFQRETGPEGKMRFHVLDDIADDGEPLRELEKMVHARGVSAVTVSRRTTDLAADIAAQARDLGAHAVVVGDRRDDPEWVGVIDRLITETTADTYVVVGPRPRPDAPPRTGPPVVEAGEGLPGEASLEAGVRFALSGTDGPVVVGITPTSTSAPLYQATLDRLARLGRASRIQEAGLDTIEGSAVTAYAPLVVRPFSAREGLQPIERARPDAERFGCPVVLVAPDLTRPERLSLTALLDSLVSTGSARRVLVSVGESGHAVRMVELAADLVARQTHGEVVITRFAPRDRKLVATGMAGEREIITGWLSDLHDLARRVERRGIPCSVLYQFSDDVAAGLVSQAADIDAEMLLVGGPREDRGEGRSALGQFAVETGLLYREFLGRVLDEARCDVGVLVHPTDGAQTMPGGPVIVALGGRHDHAALEMAARVAQSRRAAIGLLARDDGDGPSAADLAERVRALDLPDVTAVVVEHSGEPPAAAAGASIVAASLDGWSDGSRLGTLDALLAHVSCPVLAVRSATPRSGDDELPYTLRLSRLRSPSMAS